MAINIRSYQPKSGPRREIRLYSVWRQMKKRCCSPANATTRDRYYDRGIMICNEWLNFEKFRKWSLTNGYRLGLSIDRIDNNGNYEPENCRWATSEVQNRNTCRNVHLTHDGLTMTQRQWASKLGIRSCTLIWRIRHWGERTALSTPKWVGGDEGRVRSGGVANRKLTEAAARKIKYQETGSNRNVAPKYGVAQSTIGHIRSGRTWKNI